MDINDFILLTSRLSHFIIHTRGDGGYNDKITIELTQAEKDDFLRSLVSWKKGLDRLIPDTDLRNLHGYIKNLADTIRWKTGAEKGHFIQRVVALRKLYNDPKYLTNTSRLSYPALGSNKSRQQASRASWRLPSLNNFKRMMGCTGRKCNSPPPSIPNGHTRGRSRAGSRGGGSRHLKKKGSTRRHR